MTNDNLTPKNLLKRWTGETPHFWKKVLKIMLSIGAVSATIAGLPMVIPGIAIPVGIITIAKYGLAVGATGATLSKLTKKDTDVPPVPSNNNQS